MATEPTGEGLNVMTVRRTSSANPAPDSTRVDRAIKKMDINVEKLTALEQRGCGRIAERHIFEKLVKAVDTAEVDLIVMEDLSRLTYDGLRAFHFFQTCVDAGVRVVVVNSHVDTAEPDWQLKLMLAAAATGLRGGPRRCRRKVSKE